MFWMTATNSGYDEFINEIVALQMDVITEINQFVSVALIQLCSMELQRVKN